MCVTVQHDALQSKDAYLAGLLQDGTQQMKVVGSGCHKSQVSCTEAHLWIGLHKVQLLLGAECAGLSCET